jgi:hypothetical protein
MGQSLSELDLVDFIADNVELVAGGVVCS